MGREYAFPHALWDLGPSSLAASPARQCVDMVQNKASKYSHIERWESVTSPLETGCTVSASTNGGQWKQRSVVSEAEPKWLASASPLLELWHLGALRGHVRSITPPMM